jgi:hypothetical protein
MAPQAQQVRMPTYQPPQQQQMPQAPDRLMLGQQQQPQQMSWGGNSNQYRTQR